MAASKKRKFTADSSTIKVAGQNDESYPLPVELLSVEETFEPAMVPWPTRSLTFKAWAIDGTDKSGGRDAMIRSVLLSRGWKDGGNPCNPEDENELPVVLSGKHPIDKIPRRALYIVGEGGSEPREYLKAFKTFGPNRYRFTMFPGSDTACYKTSTARMFRGCSFHPQTFILPTEREQLLEAHAAATSQGAPCYWVGKPKNGYAGRGLVVSSDPISLLEDFSEESHGSSKSARLGVIQRYISNPLLVGGFKSHMRVYMLITSIEPEVRAYIHTGICVMFTTLPFSLDEQFLFRRDPPPPKKSTSKQGKARKSVGGPVQSPRPEPVPSFEPRVHLSNFDINARPENLENYLADKPMIGRGSLWPTARFEAWLRAHRGGESSVAQMWRQLRLIGRACALGIAKHRRVRELNKGAPSGLQHELFGLDVMMDDTGKCWLLECNNSPGLEYCGSHFPDGTEDPDAAENDAVTWSVIEDRFALLGIDRAVEGNAGRGNARNYLRVC